MTRIMQKGNKVCEHNGVRFTNTWLWYETVILRESSFKNQFSESLGMATLEVYKKNWI